MEREDRRTVTVAELGPRQLSTIRECKESSVDHVTECPDGLPLCNQRNPHGRRTVSRARADPSRVCSSTAQIDPFGIVFMGQRAATLDTFDHKGLGVERHE